MTGLSSDHSEGSADQSPIVLVHGVFGSGKSLLVAITLTFLAELMRMNEEQTGQVWLIRELN